MHGGCCDGRRQSCVKTQGHAGSGVHFVHVAISGAMTGQHTRGLSGSIRAKARLEGQRLDGLLVSNAGVITKMPSLCVPCRKASRSDSNRRSVRLTPKPLVRQDEARPMRCEGAALSAIFKSAASRGERFQHGASRYMLPSTASKCFSNSQVHMDHAIQQVPMRLSRGAARSVHRIMYSRVETKRRRTLLMTTTGRSPAVSALPRTNFV